MSAYRRYLKLITEGIHSAEINSKILGGGPTKSPMLKKYAQAMADIKPEEFADFMSDLKHALLEPVLNHLKYDNMGFSGINEISKLFYKTFCESESELVRLAYDLSRYAESQFDNEFCIDVGDASFNQFYSPNKIELQDFIENNDYETAYAAIEFECHKLGLHVKITSPPGSKYIMIKTTTERKPVRCYVGIDDACRYAVKNYDVLNFEFTKSDNLMSAMLDLDFDLSNIKAYFKTLHDKDADYTVNEFRNPDSPLREKFEDAFYKGKKLF